MNSQATIHSSAIVADAVIIGDGSIIHEFVVIRKDATIGTNVVIHPHVVIESGVTIKDNVEIFPGAYIGKIPKGAGVLSRKPTFKPQIVIGENSTVGPHAIIYYDVIIGKNTLIGDGASIREQCRIGDFCLISRYVTLNYNVTIGNRTKIMDATHITGNSIIGDNVFISLQVGTTNDNHVQDGYREGEILGPTIHDGAFIGAGAILLPGIKIGSHSIVGSGSVVNKDVGQSTLAIGYPARFVKSLDQPSPKESGSA